MNGEEDLSKLLATLSPTLLTGEFVFVCFKDACYGDHSEFAPIASVVESEGLTLVISRTKADDHRLAYASVFRCITLGVHSSLTAVGLTAAVSARLAGHDISANVVAGCFHDHVFVQAERAAEALSAIRALAA
jgi:hypothetical protein